MAAVYSGWSPRRLCLESYVAVLAMALIVKSLGQIFRRRSEELDGGVRDDVQSVEGGVASYHGTLAPAGQGANLMAHIIAQLGESHLRIAVGVGLAAFQALEKGVGEDAVAPLGRFESGIVGTAG